MKIVHCADLHLTSQPGEKEYSFSVLAELVELCETEKADFLILAGDVFDSYADLENLKRQFSAAIESCTTTRVLAIPGNHEMLGTKDGDVSIHTLGQCRWLTAAPFSIATIDSVEFLAIPFQKSIREYSQWNVPEKKAQWRIALAHGSVSGMGFFGDSEADSSIIDPDLFARFAVDYAAMGHLHQYRAQTAGRCTIAYSGSARVWRSGEEGPRVASVIQLDSESPPPVRFVPLKSAGQYRKVTLAIGLQGSVDIAPAAAAQWSERDWLDFELSGIIESDQLLDELESRIRRQLPNSPRKLTIDTSAVASVPSFATNLVARKFIQLCQKELESATDEENRRLWLSARSIGLQKLREHMEARA